MPVRAPRICSCGKVVPPGVTCPCQAKRKAESDARHDRKRGTSSQRGYTGAWDRAAKAFLALRENRRCKWPGCTAAARHVDHKTPHKGDKSLFWDRTNWQGLCAHHHNSSKQRLERRQFRKDDT